MGVLRGVWNGLAGWFAPFFGLADRFSKKGKDAQARMDDAWTPLANDEIKPPWVAFPGYGPGDTFWRQTGESYMATLWEPYYEGLSEEDKGAYLKRWEVPEEWWRFHFDPAWREFMERADED
jgi:hypothetical protein